MAAGALLIVWSAMGLMATRQAVGSGQSGIPRDRYDILNNKLKTAQEHPCQCTNLLKYQLYMPQDSVSHVPKYPTLENTPHFQNRTSLVHLHNMALNRAFFFSFAFQKFNRSVDFRFNPKWQYYYMSTAADVNANDNYINGSAVFFDQNSNYPNWLTDVPFNRTFPLFGPSAHRSEVPTGANPGVTVKDLGVTGGLANYSEPIYKMNPWFELWLPDDYVYADSLRKPPYSVGIRYSSSTGHFTTEDFQITRFHGPSTPDQVDQFGNLPVVFTKPYFDCGQSNKWVVSATSPVVDYMARYSQFAHLRRPKFVAVVVMSIDFERVDINPCPLSEGNPPPNYLAGIAKCKQNSKCTPLPGYGLRRGGYRCECAEGYTYPPGVQGPYRGEDMEKATEEELTAGFNCVSSNPSSSDVPRTRRSVKTKRSSERQSRNTAPITAANCGSMAIEALYLPNNVPYGGNAQLEAEARTALRLAHFLSNYLQNSRPNGKLCFVSSEHPLHEDHIFGEVLSNVMANYKIASSGVFFDAHAFPYSNMRHLREFFGPYAWRTRDGRYLAQDAAGLQTRYTQEDWFQEMKQRWSSTENISTLKKFGMNSFVRPYYDALNNLQLPPETYSAASLLEGSWGRPRFKCDSQIDHWVVTFAVPFFGMNPFLQNLQFKGVVTVDVLLPQLQNTH